MFQPIFDAQKLLSFHTKHNVDYFGSFAQIGCDVVAMVSYGIDVLLLRYSSSPLFSNAMLGASMVLLYRF